MTPSDARSGQVSWRWVDRRSLVLLHDECLAAHGGASGEIDEPIFAGWIRESIAPR